MLAQQTNYKLILQHLDEYNEREALYKLQSYQTAFPQKPHPYYLMGNLNFKMQASEHPLADYDERQKMIYNARVYYGNCRAYMENEKVKADLYPEAADEKGKLSDERLYSWLTARIDTLTKMGASLDTLYDRYCHLVNRYDTCTQLFTQFMGRYGRYKNALLMLDAEDNILLQGLRETAQLLPYDIVRFDSALANFPIDGYQPVFRFRPISFYRLEGLTTTDFLQNDIPLWDYALWVDELMEDMKSVEALRSDMQQEQKRLADALKGTTVLAASSENTMLLNRIRKYDEDSPMAMWLHEEYLVAAALALENRIVCDSLTEDDWLGCLQLADRHARVAEEFEAERQLITLNDELTLRKYRTFVQDNWGDTWQTEAMNSLRGTLSKSKGRITQWIAQQTAMPQEVQIDETRKVRIENGVLIYGNLSD